VSALPDKLRTDLADARVAGIPDISERSVVLVTHRVDLISANVTARIRELRMVEYVEEFTPELQGHCFGNGNNLRYSEIGVVEARAMEESAIRGSETSAIRTDQSP